MTTESQPEREVLRQMASVVAYEFAMLREAADEVVYNTEEGSVPHVLALEAFLLHCRNLLDFFAPRNPRPSDITHARFTTQSFDPSEEHRTDLDKWLAHLTTERLRVFTGKRKGWPVPAMRANLAAVWSEFLEALDSEGAGRSDWFTRPISAGGLPPEAEGLDLYHS